MSYLVMEVHPAYAVVLDEKGRFLKAANLRYQVGDTVRDIVELRHPREKRPALWKPLSGVAGLAACLCLVFFGLVRPDFRSAQLLCTHLLRCSSGILDDVGASSDLRVARRSLNHAVTSSATSNATHSPTRLSRPRAVPVSREGRRRISIAR